MLLFLTFSVLVANPKKILYTVANLARGLLNREKRTKEKVWQHTPTPHTARHGCFVIRGAPRGLSSFLFVS